MLNDKIIIRVQSLTAFDELKLFIRINFSSDFNCFFEYQGTYHHLVYNNSAFTLGQITNDDIAGKVTIDLNEWKLLLDTQ